MCLSAILVCICLFARNVEITESANPTETTSEEITEPTEDTISYDVNNDGKFDINDVVYLQKLLSAETGTGSGNTETPGNKENKTESTTNPSSEQTENKTTGDTQ